MPVSREVLLKPSSPIAFFLQYVVPLLNNLIKAFHAPFRVILTIDESLDFSLSCFSLVYHVKKSCIAIILLFGFLMIERWVSFL